VDGSFRRIFGGGTVAGMDEGELLRRFATRRDPSALEALVVRHGPMVLGVCRRVLVNRDASEDAFQATFLILARKAGSIRDPDRLGPWLHGVAHRVALRSRADRARRQARERTGTEEPAMAAASSEPDFDRSELKSTLDEEVRRLPQKFRDPIVLCYLDGLTHDEAAAHLACPVGTVRSRLATGREKLRDRLSRRGVTVPSALFAGVLTTETASAAISPALLLSTVRASTAFASGMAGATAAGLVPASVASLAEGVTKTMIVSKLKIVAGLALTGVLTLGVGGATAQKLGGTGEAEKVQQKADDTPEQQITELKLQALKAQLQVKTLEAEVTRLKAELQAAQEQAQFSLEALKSVKSTTFSKSGQGQAINGSGASTTGQGQAINGSGASIGSTNTASGVGTASSTSAGGPVKGGTQTTRSVSGAGGTMMAGNDSDVKTYQTAQFVVVHKAKSDKVAAYSNQTGEWTSYTAPKGTDVVPIYTAGLVALNYRGGEIGQIATYVARFGKWFPIDLKEPAKGELTPHLSDGFAIYTSGHHAYGFSISSQSWEVVELSEGEKPTVTTTAGNTGTVRQGDHVYIFNARAGKWTTPYTKTDQPVESEKK
jgi:RNA polymerase sigma factor (sigma-70 family)